MNPFLSSDLIFSSVDKTDTRVGGPMFGGHKSTAHTHYRRVRNTHTDCILKLVNERVVYQSKLKSVYVCLLTNLLPRSSVSFVALKTPINIFNQFTSVVLSWRLLRFSAAHPLLRASFHYRDSPLVLLPPLDLFKPEPPATIVNPLRRRLRRPSLGIT